MAGRKQLHDRQKQAVELAREELAEARQVLYACNASSAGEKRLKALSEEEAVFEQDRVNWEQENQAADHIFWNAGIDNSMIEVNDLRAKLRQMDRRREGLSGMVSGGLGAATAQDAHQALDRLDGCERGMQTRSGVAETPRRAARNNSLLSTGAATSETLDHQYTD